MSHTSINGSQKENGIKQNGQNSYGAESFSDNKEEKTISIKFYDGVEAEYPYCWFRDNCRCNQCFSSAVNQRTGHIMEIPEDLELLEIEKQSDIFTLKWGDDHTSTFDSKFLYDNYYGNWKNSQSYEKLMWSGIKVPNEIVYIDKEKFLNSEDSLNDFLNSLLKFGVAFVENVEPTLEDTERVIKRVAPIQRTVFGEMWEFTSYLERPDLSYTNKPLAPHTDGSEFADSPGLQVLHCLKHDGTGGESIIMDGLYVAELLKKTKPACYKTLTTELQPAKYEEEGWHHYHCDPVIKIDPLTQQIRQIRYSVNDRTSHCVSADPKKIKETHEALREFGKICDSEEVKWVFKLKPGTAMFFDNWRLLHGRTGFTGERVMGGAYISRGDWLSAARVRGLIH